MRLAMIGAGNVGSALGHAWLRAGEDVVFGIPDPSDPKYQALPRERLFEPEAAARNAEIVVLATLGRRPRPRSRVSAISPARS